MAHQDMSIYERTIALAEEGGLSASTAGELYGVLKSTARAWATEILVGWASWRAQSYWVMAYIQPSSGYCISS